MLDGCRLGIPIFHVYGHNVSCQVQEVNKIHAYYSHVKTIIMLLCHFHAVHVFSTNVGEMWPH